MTTTETINILQIDPKDYPIELEAWLAWQDIDSETKPDFATFSEVFVPARKFLLQQEKNKLKGRSDND